MNDRSGDDSARQPSIDRLQSLFRRLVSVQEDERRRIARDLHDHLGQQLTALRMNLEVFRLQCELDDAKLQQLERTQRLADDLDRSIDFLIWQLRPPALQQLGLSAALKALVDSWRDRFSLNAEYHTREMESVRLERAVEENLYRIAQEAMNNVVKHANATRVNVFFRREGDWATLLIEDNGDGFNFEPDRINADECFGLTSMRERAELIGARMRIDSEPGNGTAITVRTRIADLP
jgi:signal transduction histidine kinase